MRILAPLAASLLALVAVRPATATHPAEVVAPGKVYYVRYCGACHGTTAKGDGPVAETMTPRPSDLTTIARAGGGVFPVNRVMRVIDGRDPIRAHGSMDMPVWGEVLKQEDGYPLASEAAVRGKIGLITAYLASIQVK